MTPIEKATTIYNCLNATLAEIRVQTVVLQCKANEVVVREPGDDPLWNVASHFTTLQTLVGALLKVYEVPEEYVYPNAGAIYFKDRAQMVQQLMSDDDLFDSGPVKLKALIGFLDTIDQYMAELRGDLRAGRVRSAWIAIQGLKF